MRQADKGKEVSQIYDCGLQVLPFGVAELELGLVHSPPLLGLFRPQVLAFRDLTSEQLNQAVIHQPAARSVTIDSLH